MNLKTALLWSFFLFPTSTFALDNLSGAPQVSLGADNHHGSTTSALSVGGTIKGTLGVSPLDPQRADVTVSGQVGKSGDRAIGRAELDLGLTLPNLAETGYGARLGSNGPVIPVLFVTGSESRDRMLHLSMSYDATHDYHKIIFPAFGYQTNGKDAFVRLQAEPLRFLFDRNIDGRGEIVNPSVTLKLGKQINDVLSISGAASAGLIVAVNETTKDEKKTGELNSLGISYDLKAGVQARLSKHLWTGLEGSISTLNYAVDTTAGPIVDRSNSSATLMGTIGGAF